jgi:CheY-like chemotaxis protein
MPRALAVLIVENDVPTQHLLSALAHRNHFEWRIAGDGRDALRDLRANDFDLILLDLLLPGLNGMEVLGQVAQDMPHLLRRIIVITAAAEALYHDCEPLKAVWGLLRKPFDLRLLETEMIGCCAKRTADPAETS